MPSASTLRQQIESALAHRIPSALTPAPRVIRPMIPTGVAEMDAMLDGGLPVGAMTEMAGPETSGRTALALSFLRSLTDTGRACAWIDVSDTFDPESAAAVGVDLARVLWVRCGVPKAAMKPSRELQFSLPEKYLIAASTKKGVHGGGCGGHPRKEVKGLAGAVHELLRPETFAPRCAEPQRRVRTEREAFLPQPQTSPAPANTRSHSGKPWTRIEQALRATDLILQAGGFSTIVLDMGSIAPEHTSRVPLATWFRYRAAAERAQSSFLLLTQHPCAKSSSELLLKFLPGEARHDEATVFTGLAHRVEVERQRFTQPPSNVVALRKTPQRANATLWKSQTPWAGTR